MRMHILVCVGLAIVLAACVPISPPAVTVQRASETAQPASPQESSPAQQPTSPPTAIITSEQPTAGTAEVAPDPEADPRAALRHSVSPEILQTAVFTLTVTETMTTTPRALSRLRRHNPRLR